MPLPDDTHREAFRLTVPDDPEDEELELEPPDAEVLAAEKRRSAAAIASVQHLVDLEELTRENRQTSGKDAFDLLIKDLRFRFRLKHLLAATAVVAIALALLQNEPGTLILLALVALGAGAMGWMVWKDREHEAQMQRRSQEIYARGRAHTGEGPPGADGLQDDRPIEGLPAADRGAWQDPLSLVRQLFQIVSPVELLVIIGVAVIVLGTLSWLGGAPLMTSVLGLVALVGFILQVVGVEFPRLVALAWWILLVAYVFVSILMAAVGQA